MRVKKEKTVTEIYDGDGKLVEKKVRTVEREFEPDDFDNPNNRPWSISYTKPQSSTADNVYKLKSKYEL